MCRYAGVVLNRCTLDPSLTLTPPLRHPIVHLRPYCAPSPGQAATGRDYRDDGSFWAPLRQGFRFEFPTEVLRLIHSEYVAAEDNHACDFIGNPLTERTDDRLLSDCRRVGNSEWPYLSLRCNCGIVGGCIRTSYDRDGQEDGYDVSCSRGDFALGLYDIEGDWSRIAKEVQRRGLPVPPIIYDGKEIFDLRKLGSAE